MQNKEIEEDGFSIDLTEEQAEDFKKTFGLDKLEEIHKRFENGTETIDDIKKHCLNYMIKTENGVELKLVETKYFEKLIEYIDQLETNNQKLIEKLEKDIKKNNEFEFMPLQVEKAYNNYYKLGKIDYAQEILEILKGEKK